MRPPTVERPTDEQILEAIEHRAGISGWVSGAAVTNYLSSKEGGSFKHLWPKHLLYRLRRLETAGKVKNRKNLNNMNLWKVVF